MIASDLISEEIPAIRTTQTGKDAFHQMGEHHVKHLPVLEDGRLVGIISEEDIFNHRLYDPIGEYDFSLLRRFSVQRTDHLFEVIRIMGENRISVVPVVEESTGAYLGMISQNKVLRAFSQTTTFAEPGAVLVLSMQRSEYSLGALSRIAEQEDVHTLASMITSKPSDELIEVTLKLRTDDLSRVVAAYERHGYRISEAFMESGYNDSLRNRYDALMRYLEV